MIQQSRSKRKYRLEKLFHLSDDNTNSVFEKVFICTHDVLKKLRYSLSKQIVVYGLVGPVKQMLQFLDDFYDAKNLAHSSLSGSPQLNPRKQQSEVAEQNNLIQVKSEEKGAIYLVRSATGKKQSNYVFLMLVCKDTFYHQKPLDQKSLVYLLLRYIGDLCNDIFIFYSERILQTFDKQECPYLPQQFRSIQILIEQNSKQNIQIKQVSCENHHLLIEEQGYNAISPQSYLKSDNCVLQKYRLHQAKQMSLKCEETRNYLLNEMLKDVISSGSLELQSSKDMSEGLTNIEKKLLIQLKNIHFKAKAQIHSLIQTCIQKTIRLQSSLVNISESQQKIDDQIDMLFDEIYYCTMINSELCPVFAENEIKFSNIVVEIDSKCQKILRNVFGDKLLEKEENSEIRQKIVSSECQKSQLVLKNIFNYFIEQSALILELFERNLVKRDKIQVNRYEVLKNTVDGQVCKVSIKQQQKYFFYLNWFKRCIPNFNIKSVINVSLFKAKFLKVSKLLLLCRSTDQEDVKEHFLLMVERNQIKTIAKFKQKKSLIFQFDEKLRIVYIMNQCDKLLTVFSIDEYHKIRNQKQYSLLNCKSSFNIISYTTSNIPNQRFYFLDDRKDTLYCFDLSTNELVEFYNEYLSNSSDGQKYLKSIDGQYSVVKGFRNNHFIALANENRVDIYEADKNRGLLISKTYEVSSVNNILISGLVAVADEINQYLLVIQNQRSFVDSSKINFKCFVFSNMNGQNYLQEKEQQKIKGNPIADIFFEANHRFGLYRTYTLSSIAPQVKTLHLYHLVSNQLDKCKVSLYMNLLNMKNHVNLFCKKDQAIQKMKQIKCIYGSLDFLNQVQSRIPLQICTIQVGNLCPLKDGNIMNNFDGYEAPIQQRCKTLSFGIVEKLLLQQKNKKTIIISIMGSQSTGKSYLLNILFGTRFTVASCRTTIGIWASLIKTEQINFLVLDCEGLFSLHRQVNEQQKLIKTLASISDFTILNLNKSLASQNLATLMMQLTKSIDVQRVGESTRNELFRGNLIIVVRDVAPGENNLIIEQLKSAYLKTKIIQQFISKLFQGNQKTKLHIETFPLFNQVQNFLKRAQQLKRKIMHASLNDRPFRNSETVLNWLKVILTQLSCDDNKLPTEVMEARLMEQLEENGRGVWEKGRQDYIFKMVIEDEQIVIKDYLIEIPSKIETISKENIQKIKELMLGQLSKKVGTNSSNLVDVYRTIDEVVRKFINKRKENAKQAIKQQVGRISSQNQSKKQFLKKLEEKKEELIKKIQKQSEEIRLCFKKCKNCFLPCINIKNHCERIKGRLQSLKNSSYQIELYLENQKLTQYQVKCCSIGIEEVKKQKYFLLNERVKVKRKFESLTDLEEKVKNLTISLRGANSKYKDLNIRVSENQHWWGQLKLISQNVQRIIEALLQQNIVKAAQPKKDLQEKRVLLKQVVDRKKNIDNVWTSSFSNLVDTIEKQLGCIYRLISQQSEVKKREKETEKDLEEKFKNIKIKVNLLEKKDKFEQIERQAVIKTKIWEDHRTKLQADEAILHDIDEQIKHEKYSCKDLQAFLVSKVNQAFRLKCKVFSEYHIYKASQYHMDELCQKYNLQIQSYQQKCNKLIKKIEIEKRKMERGSSVDKELQVSELFNCLIIMENYMHQEQLYRKSLQQLNEQIKIIEKSLNQQQFEHEKQLICSICAFIQGESKQLQGIVQPIKEFSALSNQAIIEAKVRYLKAQSKQNIQLKWSYQQLQQIIMKENIQEIQSQCFSLEKEKQDILNMIDAQQGTDEIKSERLGEEQQMVSNKLMERKIILELIKYVKINQCNFIIWYLATLLKSSTYNENNQALGELRKLQQKHQKLKKSKLCKQFSEIHYEIIQRSLFLEDMIFMRSQAIKQVLQMIKEDHIFKKVEDLRLEKSLLFKYILYIFVNSNFSSLNDKMMYRQDSFKRILSLRDEIIERPQQTLLSIIVKSVTKVLKSNKKLQTIKIQKMEQQEVRRIELKKDRDQVKILKEEINKLNEMRVGLYKETQFFSKGQMLYENIDIYRAELNNIEIRRVKVRENLINIQVRHETLKQVAQQIECMNKAKWLQVIEEYKRQAFTNNHWHKQIQIVKTKIQEIEGQTKRCSSIKEQIKESLSKNGEDEKQNDLSLLRIRNEIDQLGLLASKIQQNKLKERQLQDIRRKMKELEDSADNQCSCQTSHQCTSHCQFGNFECKDKPCDLQAGHEKNHRCSSHFCTFKCTIGLCQRLCQRIYDHSNQQPHQCGQSHQCDKICKYCDQRCSKDIFQNHEQHMCKKGYCTKKCILCKNLCRSNHHDHDDKTKTVKIRIANQRLNQNQYQELKLHLCSEKHDCPSFCSHPGVCENIYKNQVKQWSKNGIETNYQYIKQIKVKKKCEIRLDQGRYEHKNKSCQCNQNHLCIQSCPDCKSLCKFKHGHEGRHDTYHRNQQNLVYAATGQNWQSQYLIEQSKGKIVVKQGDIATPFMCRQSCKNKGRGHFHLIQCRGKQRCLQNIYIQGVKHSHEVYKPFTQKRYDMVLCKKYWQIHNFAIPYEDKTIELCNFKCDMIEQHKDKKPVYCSFPAWHSFSEDKKDHNFSCNNTHKLMVVAAVEICFLIDVTASMAKYIKICVETVKKIIENSNKNIKQKMLKFAVVGYRDHKMSQSPLFQKFKRLCITKMAGIQKQEGFKDVMEQKMTERDFQKNLLRVQQTYNRIKDKISPFEDEQISSFQRLVMMYHFPFVFDIRTGHRFLDEKRRKSSLYKNVMRSHQYLKEEKSVKQILKKQLSYYLQDLNRVESQQNSSFQEYNLLQVLNFCDNIKCIQFLEDLEDKGGGDPPEAVFDGLDRAIKLPWAQGDNTLRYIFHLFDAPPHGQIYDKENEDYYPEGCPCNIKPENLVNELKRKQINYIVYPLTGRVENTLKIFKSFDLKFHRKTIQNPEEFRDHATAFICSKLEQNDFLVKRATM